MNKKEINALSDEQINEMVGKLEYRTADYCSDAGYMIPVMFDYGISLHHNFYGHNDYTASVGDRWGILTDACGTFFNCDHQFTEKRPLRAAAIVYLKMKGAL
ncbi:MAG: hypothetical protein ACRCUK_04700 [Plesiomonas shigelloides]